MRLRHLCSKETYPVFITEHKISCVLPGLGASMFEWGLRYWKQSLLRPTWMYRLANHQQKQLYLTDLTKKQGILTFLVWVVSVYLASRFIFYVVWYHWVLLFLFEIVFQNYQYDFSSGLSWITYPYIQPGCFFPVIP